MHCAQLCLTLPLLQRAGHSGDDNTVALHQAILAVELLSYVAVRNIHRADLVLPLFLQHCTALFELQDHSQQFIVERAVVNLYWIALALSVEMGSASNGASGSTTQRHEELLTDILLTITRMPSGCLTRHVSRIAVVSRGLLLYPLLPIGQFVHHRLCLCFPLPCVLLFLPLVASSTLARSYTATCTLDLVMFCAALLSLPMQTPHNSLSRSLLFSIPQGLGVLVKTCCVQIISADFWAAVGVLTSR